MRGITSLLLLCCCCSWAWAQTMNSSSTSFDSSTFIPTFFYSSTFSPTLPPALNGSEQCCEFYNPNNLTTFNMCCEDFGQCPICSPDCSHNGTLYSVGEIIEANPKKCYYLKCCWRNNMLMPYPAIEHVGEDQCDCCEHDGMLYPRGAILHIGDCRRQRCIRGGQWKDLKQRRRRFKACPQGYTEDEEGGNCLMVEPIWLSWEQAGEHCRSLNSELVRYEERLQPLVSTLVGCVGAVWLGDVQPPLDGCRVQGLDGPQMVPSGTVVTTGDEQCVCREGAVVCDQMR